MIPPAPPPSRLTELLTDLLSLEALPPLDRWFSGAARVSGWPVSEQRVLWDALRRAMTRAFTLAKGETWPEFRVAMRGRASEWARVAEALAPPASTASAGVPRWLNEAFEERARLSGWSEAEKQTFLSSQEGAPPVYVRFRFGREGDACRERMLSSHEVEPTEAGAFRLCGTRGLESTPEWKQGLVEIQDAASQRSLDSLAIRPGMKVWDVCAGHGGKTLLAANELRGKGALVATDIAENKLKALKERVRRSGWQNIRILPWDGEKAPSWGPEFTEGFDRVVVDAPCTATGTWRKDPEARFRVTPVWLEELRRHQARLLALGWAALKPRGRLAYLTCSWLPAENEAIVDAFVRQSGARVVGQELGGLPRFDAGPLFTAVLEKS